MAVWSCWSLKKNEEVLMDFLTSLATVTMKNLKTKWWHSTPTLLSPDLPKNSRQNQTPKSATQLQLRMICWSLGESNVGLKKIENWVETELKNRSSELVSNLPPSPAITLIHSDPMTLTNSSKVWWYDFVEVSRKIKKFWWTFGRLSLPTTKNYSTTTHHDTTINATLPHNTHKQ